MAKELLREYAASSVTTLQPELKPGYTVRVHERIKERERERVQVFEGLVISVHKGKVPTDTTFTVRRIASGVGVERVFPFASPLIEKVEVKKVARVRRAKLFFLRGRRGKSARLSERFTTADEFAVALPPEPEPVVAEEAADVSSSAPASAEAMAGKEALVDKREAKKEKEAKEKKTEA